jgi:hypothetical protein
MTGHVLCMALFSPNGFIPSVLKKTLYFYSPLQILDTEDQNFFTVFHPWGVECPHHFPYASQITSTPVPHPYGWSSHVSNDRSLEGTTSPKQEFSS